MTMRLTDVRENDNEDVIPDLWTELTRCEDLCTGLVLCGIGDGKVRVATHRHHFRTVHANVELTVLL